MLVVLLANIVTGSNGKNHQPGSLGWCHRSWVYFRGTGNSSEEEGWQVSGSPDGS